MLKHFLPTICLVLSGAMLFAQAAPSAPKGEEPVKRMAADAHPVFEVVTIKPSQPSDRIRSWDTKGRYVIMRDFRVVDLIEVAYGLHLKQIAMSSEWVGTEKFDIDGVPDSDGVPNYQQLRMMFRQLLADRFGLTFHWEEKELSAYVITVAKGGPKMKKSTADPNDIGGFLFRGQGKLVATNMSMLDFADRMQRSVMDKPVVDQTGLPGQYDFTLNWTPDDSQFIPMGWKIRPPSADDPAAPPNLYVALEEQIGLKMEPVKTMVRVMVIDHIEQPSAN